MSKKRILVSAAVFGTLLVLLLVGILIVGPPAKHESIQAVMRDEVLHDAAKVNLFGLLDVNPGLIAAFTVTGLMTLFAIAVRIFVIPRFTYIPGKFQLLLERAVGLFDNLAKSSSPHRNKFVGAYIFIAGSYITVSTLFELLGVQVLSKAGNPLTLPAPLSDINGAIAMGVMSYGVVLVGGLIANGLRGAGKALKEFSLPISMSFRLFGALLSGALVTQLVYYYSELSYVLPVLVGILFTLLHAIIQTYVLTMLTAMYYGESTEPSPKKPKRKKAHKSEVQQYENA